MFIPDNYFKLEAVNSFLKSKELESNKYSQFTKDFIESWCYRGEIKEKLKDAILALVYEVENILDIMKSDIEDYSFFVELRQIIGKV